MANRRVAGIAYLKVDGRQLETSGEFTINPGQPKREGKLGTARIAGFKEEPQIPMIEGKLVLTRDLSLLDITKITEATVSVVAPNGATYVLREAWFSGEGTYTTGEGEVAVKFEGVSMEEVRAA